jgi:hypothetical protein
MARVENKSWSVATARRVPRRPRSHQWMGYLEDGPRLVDSSPLPIPELCCWQRAESSDSSVPTWFELDPSKGLTGEASVDQFTWDNFSDVSEDYKS